MGIVPDLDRSKAVRHKKEKFPYPLPLFDRETAMRNLLLYSAFFLALLWPASAYAVLADYGSFMLDYPADWRISERYHNRHTHIDIEPQSQKAVVTVISGINWGWDLKALAEDFARLSEATPPVFDGNSYIFTFVDYTGLFVECALSGRAKYYYVECYGGDENLLRRVRVYKLDEAPQLNP